MANFQNIATLRLPSDTYTGSLRQKTKTSTENNFIVRVALKTFFLLIVPTTFIVDTIFRLEERRVYKKIAGLAEKKAICVIKAGKEEFVQLKKDPKKYIQTHWKPLALTTAVFTTLIIYKKLSSSKTPVAIAAPVSISVPSTPTSPAHNESSSPTTAAKTINTSLTDLGKTLTANQTFQAPTQLGKYFFASEKSDLKFDNPYAKLRETPSEFKPTFAQNTTTKEMPPTSLKLSPMMPSWIEGRMSYVAAVGLAAALSGKILHGLCRTQITQEQLKSLEKRWHAASTKYGGKQIQKTDEASRAKKASHKFLGEMKRSERELNEANVDELDRLITEFENNLKKF